MSLRSRLMGFLYNLDRAIASLLGAPPQETISSEVGRHSTEWAASILCHLLNWVQPGHCAHAVAHANKLDQANDKFEG